VIIHDLDVKSVSIPPSETNPPLIVDSYAVLSCPVSFQCLETVAAYCRQILPAGCRVKAREPGARSRFNPLKFAAADSLMKSFRFGTSERADHPLRILCNAYYVNRNIIAAG
jgi:hypothetical protein